MNRVLNIIYSSLKVQDQDKDKDIYIYIYHRPIL